MRISGRVILAAAVLAFSLAAWVQPAYADHEVYVVQRGDNLYQIGMKYGLTATALKRANGLTSDIIYVGQRLVIPHSESDTTAPSDAEDAPEGGIHVVQRGEYLSLIAKRYGITLQALMTANRLNRTTIYPGERLVIPGVSPEEVAATATAEPAPEPAPEAAGPTNHVTGIAGRHFLVDLSEQRIYAYEGETLMMSTLVSTGTWQHPTVQGLFYIYVKYESARMTGPGYNLPGVPWVMYFYKGYGIHGTYWHNNFGTPMSHGCVNLATPDADWAFHWASVGTPVLVQS